MVFSSPTFLFAFFPVFFALYYLIRPGGRNALLFVASLIFYFSGAGSVVLVLLFSVPFNQAVGRMIAARSGARAAKAALAFGVVANLLPLILYKYLDFFGRTFHDALHLFGVESTVNLPSWLLPAGISFFTFQGISYLIDLYRRQIEPAPTMIDFGMYHTSFPQLIAGPIVRYAEIADRVVRRPIILVDVEWGIVRFCAGLAKKIVIADNLGKVTDHIFELPPGQLTTRLAWLATITYTLQIYFDFSGYSDMAIGMGRMLGFRFPENFDQPYRAQSMTEFWHRWHMTLSRWFRDYVYIPLGGNRAGARRTYVNLFIVFFLCGLWHGAAYTFVVWGLLHGLVLVVERLLRSRLGFVPSGIPGWAATQFLVMLAWVFFRADTVHKAFLHLAAMFGLGTATSEVFTVAFYMTPDRIFFLCVGMLVALLPAERFFPSLVAGAAPGLPLKAGALTIFVYSVTQIAANGFNPFIYFRF